MKDQTAGGAEGAAVALVSGIIEGRQLLPPHHFVGPTIDRGDDGGGLGEVRDADAADVRDQIIGIIRGTQPHQGIGALRKEVARLRVIRHRSDPNARILHEPVWHIVSRRIEHAAQDEARRNLRFPGIAGRQDRISTLRERLSRGRENCWILRNRPLIDGNQWLARGAVEQKQITIATHDRDSLVWTAPNDPVKQYRRDGKIGFPHIVVYELVVPAKSAGFHLEGNQRHAVEIIPWPYPAAGPRAGIARHEVNQAERPIGRSADPGVGTA